MIQPARVTFVIRNIGNLFQMLSITTIKQIQQSKSAVHGPSRDHLLQLTDLRLEFHGPCTQNAHRLQNRVWFRLEPSVHLLISQRSPFPTLSISNRKQVRNCSSSLPLSNLSQSTAKVCRRLSLSRNLPRTSQRYAFRRWAPENSVAPGPEGSQRIKMKVE